MKLPLVGVGGWGGGGITCSLYIGKVRSKDFILESAFLLGVGMRDDSSLKALFWLYGFLYLAPLSHPEKRPLQCLHGCDIRNGGVRLLLFHKAAITNASHLYYIPEFLKATYRHCLI